MAEAVATPHPQISQTVNKTTPDDLLEAYDAEESDKGEAVDKEVEKQAAVARELPKKLAAEKLVKKLEESESEEEEAPASEEASEDSEQGDRKVTDEFPSIKARFNDEDIDIPEAATVSVRIGNKDVEVSVKQAVDAYQHQEKAFRELNQRASHIDNKQKTFQREFAQIDGLAGEVVRYAMEGKVEPVIRLMATISSRTKGLDPVEMEKRLLEGVAQTGEVWKNLSEAQKATYFANRKAALAEEQLNKFKTRDQTQASQAELETQIKGLCSEHGLSEDNFYGAFKALVDNQVGPGKLWKSPDEITPADVISLHQRALAHEAIQKTNPELLTADPDILDYLTDIIKDEKGLTVEDIQEILKTAVNMPSKSVENLNRKVARSASQTLNNQIRGAASQKSKKSEDSYSKFWDSEFSKRRQVSR